VVNINYNYHQKHIPRYLEGIIIAIFTNVHNPGNGTIINYNSFRKKNKKKLIKKIKKIEKKL
jgi:hypothetical protein